jgi:hypothetical protein
MENKESKPLLYKLDRLSSIEEDLIILGIDKTLYASKKGTMIQSTLLAIFENHEMLILYMYIPLKDVTLLDITINKIKYGVQAVDSTGFIGKYTISKRFKSGKLSITEYGFIDQSLTKTTYQVHEEHVFGILHGQYFYDSKKYYQTQLIGELFYQIIDMRTIQDKVESFFSKRLRSQDIKFHQSPFAKLYYVAFNLFDTNKNKPFVPEDIVDMKVKYDALRYVYQNKDSKDLAKVDPLTAGVTYPSTELQVVEKENRLIETGEKSDWNILQNFFTYKAYRYDAIFNLKDKDIKLNSPFTYALFVGPKKGYRYSQSIVKKKNITAYDYEETTLKNISIFHLTYQEKGLRYSLPVQSLIYESNKKQQLPRLRNQLRNLLKTLAIVAAFPFKFVFGASGVLIKVVKFLVKYWKLVLLFIVLLLIAYLYFTILNIIR